MIRIPKESITKLLTIINEGATKIRLYTIDGYVDLEIIEGGSRIINSETTNFVGVLAPVRIE